MKRHSREYIGDSACSFRTSLPNKVRRSSRAGNLLPEIYYSLPFEWTPVSSFDKILYKGEILLVLGSNPQHLIPKKVSIPCYNRSHLRKTRSLYVNAIYSTLDVIFTGLCCLHLNIGLEYRPSWNICLKAHEWWDSWKLQTMRVHAVR